MMQLLVGILIGAMVGVGAMCLVQINRLKGGAK